MILEALEREGVEYIFGYPGGANLPIYQHLPEHPKLKHILVRHEQGAAHMADGYARACITSWSATSRAPRTWPTASRARPAASACASRRPAPARRIS